MPEEYPADIQVQSQFMDEFLYFFLRVRKERIHMVVERMRSQYPDESLEQLARRLISSKSQLSFIGGTLVHVPMLLSGIGQALKLLGFVVGTSVLTRMHLYLILEIALLYGKDIDDKARIAEMAAVVAAVGLGVSVPFLVQLLEFNPLYALPVAELSATAVTQLVGESAIRFYGETASLPVGEALPAT